MLNGMIVERLCFGKYKQNKFGSLDYSLYFYIVIKKTSYEQRNIERTSDDQNQNRIS